MIKNLLILLTIIFVSYSIGRISHILGGHLNAPHHWIYGVILAIVGLFFRQHQWGQCLIVFGIGFIVSDFKDMIDLKFFGVDDVEIKRFWGID